MNINKIVLEGVDGAGKSTFAKMIKAKFGYDIVQGSSFEIAEKGVDAMYRHMDRLLDMENIIIDRFYLSNYIYANLFDKIALSNKQIEQLTRKSLDETVTVLLLPSYDLVVDRLDVRGDEYVKTKDVRQILDKYNALTIENESKNFLGNLLIAEYSSDSEADKEFIKMIDSLGRLIK